MKKSLRVKKETYSNGNIVSYKYDSQNKRVFTDAQYQNHLLCYKEA